MNPPQKSQKLQFPQWARGSKHESFPTDTHVKLPRFNHENNIFSAWYKMPLLSIDKPPPS